MSTFNKYRLKGAFHYDWYETEDWYKWAVDRCVSFCQGKTVDAGCGDGVILSKLQEKGFWALGLDNDPTAIQMCEDRGLMAWQWDLNEAVGIKPPFDYLCSLNSVEHLHNTNGLKALIRQAAIGAIIITIDWQGGAFGEDHKKEYTQNDLDKEFAEFKPKRFRYKDTEWIGIEIRTKEYQA